MIFFEKSGIMTIGSRLRWLADVVIRDAAEIYKTYGIDIKPKWFPVLYMLFDGSDSSVTGIAKAIGQTTANLWALWRYAEWTEPNMILNLQNSP